jgi:hypothetical protein
MPVRVVQRIVISTAIVATVAGISCDCAPTDKPMDDGAAESSASEDADSASGVEDTHTTTGVLPETTSEGDPPDVEWAMDAFHIASETHGETTQFQVEKIELFRDGTTKQTTILCGLSDRIFEGRWRSSSAGVVIEPPPGDDIVVFAQTHYSKLVLTESERCEEVHIQGFNPTGIETGGDTLLRGNLCLNCAAVGYDQLQCCDNMQPVSICDISRCRVRD